MTGVVPALAATGLALFAAWVGGFFAAGAIVPASHTFRAERGGWGIVLGLAVVALGEAACLAVSARPSRFALLAALVLVGAVGIFVERSRTSGAAAGEPAAGRRGAVEAVGIALGAVAAAGCLLYVLRALAEPMWSNDFVAIWGLKAKTLFAAGRLPEWLGDPEVAGYSHPEYPLGLPLALAGVATLAGSWDDQALALVYPLLQAATLLVLFGWLRRRGAGPKLALSATALVALFEPLYSAFLVGMAEVPLSLAILLVAVSLSDALDRTDTLALRRLAAASLVAASLKNEGFFVAVVAAALAVLSSGERRRRLSIAAAALLPALVPTVLARVLRGPVPLRDFDFGLVAPPRWGELASRLGIALREDVRLAAGALPVLAAIVILFACGRSGPAARWADRPLILGLVALAAYLTLPAFAVMGPVWLAQTTLFRTAAALVPLAAAGLAGRLAGVYAAPTPSSSAR